MRDGAAVPKMKKLWASFYHAYDVDVVVVPSLPTTARPIDDVEPYMTFNGKKASPFLEPGPRRGGKVLHKKP